LRINSQKRITKLNAIFIYFVSFSIPVVVVLGFFDLGNLAIPGVWRGHGDILFFQAQAQVVADNGLFGRSGQLGWPGDYSIWSFPQAGFGIGALFFIFGALFQASSSTTLVLSLASLAGFNSAASLFFFRSLSKVKKLNFYSLTSAVSISTSPFVLLKMEHINVAGFFLVPLAIGLALRVKQKPGSPASFGIAFLSLALASVLSPMWWIVVTLFLVGMWALAQLAARKTRSVIGTALVLCSTLIGFAAQALVFATAPNSLATGRGVWDSNIYGGRLTDFLVASPFLNSVFDISSLLRAGASEELSLVGFWGALCAALAVIAPVVMIFAQRALDSRFVQLLGLSVLVSLTFISGGFGNLQASILWIFGEASPARAWARLAIVLSLLGAALILLALEKKLDAVSLSGAGKREENTRLPLVAATLVALLSIADYTHTSPPDAWIAFSKLDEYKAVEFIEERFEKDCPVLQLPMESTPWYKSPYTEEFPSVMYGGYIPFLMSPERSWSFGDLDQTERRQVFVDEVSTEVTPAAVKTLRDTGFCLVLFDKRLATASIDSGSLNKGTYISDVFGTPLFVSERFDVYSIP
jgi:hypothetical protein